MTVAEILETAQKHRVSLSEQQVYFQRLDLLAFWKNYPHIYRFETSFQGHEYNDEGGSEPVVSFSFYDKDGVEIDDDYCNLFCNLYELELPAIDDTYSRPKNVDRKIVKLAYKANWIPKEVTIKNVYVVTGYVDYYDDSYSRISDEEVALEIFLDRKLAKSRSEAMNNSFVKSRKFEEYREWDRDLDEDLKDEYEELSSLTERKAFLKEHIPEMLTWVSKRVVKG